MSKQGEIDFASTLVNVFATFFGISSAGSLAMVALPSSSSVGGMIATIIFLVASAVSLVFLLMGIVKLKRLTHS